MNIITTGIKQNPMSEQAVKTVATFNVMVPIKPAFTVTGSFSALRASAFNFKSLRTTSPVNEREYMSMR